MGKRDVVSFVGNSREHPPECRATDVVVGVVFALVRVVALASENTSSSVGNVVESCSSADGVEPPAMGTVPDRGCNLHGLAKGGENVVAMNVLGWDFIDFFKSLFDGGNRTVFIENWKKGVL